jgi:cell division protein FtsL
MVGQVIDRKVLNYRVKHRNRDENTREIIYLALGLILLVLLGMGYIYIPNRLVALDYQMEQAKAELGRLQQEQSALQMKECVLTAPARLEAEAERLGFKPLEIAQVQFVDTADLTAGQADRLAMNTPPTAGAKR